MELAQAMLVNTQRYYFFLNAVKSSITVELDHTQGKPSKQKENLCLKLSRNVKQNWNVNQTNKNVLPGAHFTIFAGVKF